MHAPKVVAAPVAAPPKVAAAPVVATAQESSSCGTGMIIGAMIGAGLSFAACMAMNKCK